LECCSKVEKLFALWWCVVEGGTLVFIQGGEAVLEAILGARTDFHHLNMEACHYWREERQGGS
jgi:hypothetical protein